MTAVILHNLAAMNYCELTDHNERVASGDGLDDDNEKLEQIKKVELEKAKKKRDDKLMRIELER